MRLICPNCRAQYEVDESAIPEGGRDVQCSNCNQTWFQDRPTQAAEPAVAMTPAPVETAAVANAPAVPQRPISEPVVAHDRKPERGTVEDSILNILREEAEREQRARAEERGEVAPEASVPPAKAAQPDTPTSDRPSHRDLTPAFAGAGAAAKQAPTDKDSNAADSSAGDTDSVRGADMLRSGTLPDLDKISSTLQEIAESIPEEDEEEAPIDPKEEARSSFSSGFAFVIVLFGLALVTYTFAPTVVRLIPGAEPYMIQYVDFVDMVRVKLDELIVTLIAFIETKT